MKIGIIPLSFALREGRGAQSLCNVRLAEATERVALALNSEGIQYLCSSQWEVALALHVPTIHVVCEHRVKGQYLDSEEVCAQSIEAFNSAGGVDAVLPIAQPFLQLHKVQQQLLNAGQKLFWRWKSYELIGWIGFDKDSDQPWTRSAPALLKYALDQMRKGKLTEKV